MLRWSGLSTARWCAALLLLMVAVSTTHAAIPDHKTQNDCSVCKALHVPGLTAERIGVTALPPPAPETLPAGPRLSPRSGNEGGIALRAPPVIS